MKRNVGMGYDTQAERDADMGSSLERLLESYDWDAETEYEESSLCGCTRIAPTKACAVSGLWHPPKDKPFAIEPVRPELFAVDPWSEDEEP